MVELCLPADEDPARAVVPFDVPAPPHDEVERGIMAQDRPLQLAQRLPGLDPELVDEDTARLLVRLESLGLAAAAVERDHVLSAESLPQWMRRDEALEVADHGGVSPQSEVGVETFFEALEPEVVEPCDLGLREALVGEVGERAPTP